MAFVYLSAKQLAQKLSGFILGTKFKPLTIPTISFISTLVSPFLPMSI